MHGMRCQRYTRSAEFQKMNKKAVVVIPVYRTNLSVTEDVSLMQALRVLGRYTIS